MATIETSGVATDLNEASALIQQFHDGCINFPELIAATLNLAGLTQDEFLVRAEQYYPGARSKAKPLFDTQQKPHEIAYSVLCEVCGIEQLFDELMSALDYRLTRSWSLKYRASNPANQKPDVLNRLYMTPDSPEYDDLINAGWRGVDWFTQNFNITRTVLHQRLLRLRKRHPHLAQHIKKVRIGKANTSIYSPAFVEIFAKSHTAHEFGED